jgi:hypothetical protein
MRTWTQGGIDEDRARMQASDLVSIVSKEEKASRGGKLFDDL